MRKVIDGAIILGAVGFIAILALSAAYDHSIIWLHVFQALMYLGVIVLIARRSPWAYLLGLSIAGLWNYINLFVTTFFANGMHALQVLIDTGKVTHPDLLIAVAAVAFHFLMIAGCLIQLLPTRRPRRGPLHHQGGDLVRLAAAFVASTAYFIVIIALFQPRYLNILSHVFQPHGL